MGWSERGCDRMSRLRAYTKNGGKIIDLLSYQKGRRKEQKLSEEEIEVKKEVYKKQAGWRYQERLKGCLPGIEQHSLKWMRAWFNQKLGGLECGFFLLDYKPAGKRTHKSRAEAEENP